MYKTWYIQRDAETPGRYGPGRLAAGTAAAPPRVHRSLRTNRYPVRAVLAGGDDLRAGAVQVGLGDRAHRAGDVVGPVQVAGVHRYPVRAALVGGDGLRAGAVQVGLYDRARVGDRALVAPVQVAGVHRDHGREQLAGGDGLRASAVQVGR